MSEIMSFSELSKKVGHSRPPSSYPKTKAEIRKASNEQILIWYRFCPTSRNVKQEELMAEVVKRFKLIPKD